MHLFIDESGSFVANDTLGSWCVVAAYVLPERSRSKVEEILRSLKVANGYGGNSEIKLKHVSDGEYLKFLLRLRSADGILFCTAVDTGTQSRAGIEHHHRKQVESLNKNIPRIRHPDGRAGHQRVADRFAELSPQLYLQIVCQYNLVLQALSQSLLYYVQRIPATLSRFRWRIDQKHHGRSVFDESFRDLAPAFMQSYSINNPQIMLEGADYRHFEKFRFPEGQPAYLRDEYGLDLGDGFNVRMVMSEDFAFVDSKENSGVQLVDLLASGLRRCLRSEFQSNDDIATAFGNLMIEAAKREPPLNLISITGETPASPQVTRAVRLMQKACRPMIVRKRQKSGPENISV